MDRFRDFLITEFRGSPPEVPLADGIDYEQLIAGDEDPMFVTLPIGEVDAVSQNKRYYDDEFVKELERQVLDKRPVANLGHLPDDRRATDFPLPAGHWVGTVRVGNTLFGKAYVPPGPVKEFMRRMKATRGKVATSIYGTSPQPSTADWDAGRGAWRVSKFNLESIDFAPADRAGVQTLADVPKITKETREDEGKTVDRLQIIQEMTVADLKFIPDDVVKAISEPAVQTVQAQIAEFAKALSVEPKAEAITQTLKELLDVRVKYEAVHKEHLQSLIVSTVAEMVAPNATQLTEGINDARSMVVELVKSRQPSDADGVKLAVKEITEQDAVKRSIERLTIAEMGGNLRRQVTPAAGAARAGQQSKYLKPKPQANQQAAS